MSDAAQTDQPPLRNPKKLLADMDRKSLATLLYQYYSEDADIFSHFEEGKPNMLIHAFFGPDQYREKVYNLPGSSFAEAFRMVSPNYYIEPYKRLHRYFHPAIIHGKGFKNLREIFSDFKEMLNSIVKQRLAAGRPLGLAEYTHLLSCASSMGDEAMARNVWKTMQEAGVEPSTECYNFYMASHVWHGALFSKEKFNLRLTQWNYVNRAAENQPPGYRGVRTGFGGTRDVIFELFKDMTTRGRQTNVITYVHLMTAACREGDMASVYKILKTVWNIDVDGLREHGEGPHLQPVTKYSRTSQLHPTNELFFCIAHVFGSNNDILMGLQLVDYVSRHYNTFIPHSAWQELFEWTFVLSQKRFKERVAENTVGYVSPLLIDDIFQTMTSAPYNVSPQMLNWNLLAKSAFIRQNLRKMLSAMQGGLGIFIRSLRARDRVGRTLVRQQLLVAPSSSKYKKMMLSRGHVPLNDEDVDHKPQSSFSSPSSTIDEYETSHLTLSKIKAFRAMDDILILKHLEVARDATLLERWVRLVMIGRRWKRNVVQWELQLLPAFIEEWRPFMPARPLYFCTAGLIVFEEVGMWKGGRRERPESALEVTKLNQLQEDKKGVDWVVWGTWKPLGCWR